MSRIDSARRDALGQAATWYALLHSGDANEQDHASCHQWLQQAADHQWAWQQVQALQQRLQQMPQGLTGRALELASAERQASRRTLLKGMALLIGSGTLGWEGYRQFEYGAWLADYKTAVGQRLAVTLADGGQLLLNTDTALDVQFDARQRLLHLRRGEVMITTAADPGRRPFRVQTTQGTVQALGTRFSVRCLENTTAVTVYEHRVRITPKQGQPVLLDAGQSTAFSAHHTSPSSPFEATRQYWTQGLLVANEQRLAEVVAELARYRTGWLRYDPSLADWRISGTFPLDDTDKALRALASALPVAIEQRTRYWVTVRAL